MMLRSHTDIAAAVLFGGGLLWIVGYAIWDAIREWWRKRKS